MWQLNPPPLRGPMSGQWPQGKAIPANGKGGVEVKAEEVLGIESHSCDHPPVTLQVTDKHVFVLD